MSDGPALFIQPADGDQFRAEDMLQEICGVLRKHSYGLIFNPKRNTMVLAKLSVFGHEARVIAEVSRLLPEGAVFAVVDRSAFRKPDGDVPKQ